MSDTAPCVLVVEDEAGAREVICDTLDAEGYRALGVADGSEAVRVLEGQLANDQRPCVILLDLMMPGMNGWQFREWQRRDPRFAEIPVVLLSAVRDLHDEARKLAAAGFLAKPVKFEVLLGEIERHCGPCNGRAAG